MPEFIVNITILSLQFWRNVISINNFAFLLRMDHVNISNELFYWRSSTFEQNNGLCSVDSSYYCQHAFSKYKCDNQIFLVELYSFISALFGKKL